MRKSCLLAWLVCALLLFTGGSMAEDMHAVVENPSVEMEVSLGYEGHFVYGRTMPVRVHLSTGAEGMTGTVAMNAYVSQTEYNRYEADVDIPAYGTADVVLPIAVTNRQDQFSAEFCQNGKVVARQTVKPEKLVNPNAYMVGVLSEHVRSLDYLNITSESDDLARMEYWQVLPLSVDTFPDSREYMSAFRFLVVDDVDLRNLSQQQMTVLRDWVEEGHIVVTSAGALSQVTLPYFTEYTGVYGEGLYTEENVSGRIQELFALRQDNSPASAACTHLFGGETLLMGTESPLIVRSSVGRGSVYALAFSLTDPELLRWSGLHTFLERLFVQFDINLYQGNVDQDFTEIYIDDYVDLPAAPVALPLALILAGSLLVLIPLLYWAFKKMDRSTMLWIVYPALILILVGGIYGVSLTSSLKTPVVLLNNQWIESVQSGAHAYSTVKVYAAEKGTHVVSTPDGTLYVPSGNYYYYDEDSVLQEPTELRYCFRNGQQSGVTMRNTHTWQEQRFSLDRTEGKWDSVDATLWMEEDGLHGSMTNHTDLTFRDGVILTRLGFLSVDRLAPGETQTFVMPWGEFQDPKDPVYADGTIYMKSAVIDGMDTMLSTWVFGKPYPYYEMNNVSPERREMVRRYQMFSSLVGNVSYMYYGSLYMPNPNYYYFLAEVDGLRDIRVNVDGSNVTRMICGNVARIQLQYLPVGKTGVIYHLGTDLPTRVETDGDGLPVRDEAEIHASLPAYAGSWHMLSEKPTFCFDLKDIMDAHIENLIVNAESYSSGIELYVLNPLTYAWEKKELDMPIANSRDYLDAQGRLYVQFHADGTSQYADMRQPTLIVEGRLDDAQH